MSDGDRDQPKLDGRLTAMNMNEERIMMFVASRITLLVALLLYNNSSCVDVRVQPLGGIMVKRGDCPRVFFIFLRGRYVGHIKYCTIRFWSLWGDIPVLVIGQRYYQLFSGCKIVLAIRRPDHGQILGSRTLHPLVS